MRVRLNPFWDLSTEHPESRHGQPVLVDRRTNQAYGPRDFVKPYLHCGSMRAVDAVRALIVTAWLDPSGEYLVRQFLRLVLPE